MNRSDQANDSRLGALKYWIQVESVRKHLVSNEISIEKVSDDASFRRYFRSWLGEMPVVLMDAPPDKETITEFLMVDERLRAAGIHAPTIYDFDQRQGFIAMEDLGAHQFAHAIRGTTAERDRALHLALDVLGRFRLVDTDGLPRYTRDKLRDEMQLFPDWFLSKHLGLSLGSEFWEIWQPLTDQLIDSALGQPQGFVHRDFHSRNLMVLDDAELGVLDFQDAVVGPATYDAVSLLRDCYITYDDEAVDRWFNQFVDRFQSETQARYELSEWWQWLDWMGFQRHLKCAGIFSRLAIRDHKLGYLKDIPRVLDHIMAVACRYEPFSSFTQWFEADVRPLVQRSP